MCRHLKAAIFAFASLLLICSCAPEPRSASDELAGINIYETVKQDLTKVYQHDAPEEKLRLEDVLARALKYNLDTKVSEMDALIAADDVTLQMLNSLPSVTAKVQRVGRNNQGGSSSFSVLTGTQSLQPSISTDQYRNTHQLEVQWNLLDAGINLWRAKSATDRVLIAQERRRKVYHDVLQDAYTAYWRVAVAQTALPVVNDLLGQIESRLERLDEEVRQSLAPLGDIQAAKAQLYERRQRLMNMRQGLILSEVELKTLIDYPLDRPILLDIGDRDWLNAGVLPEIKGAPEDFERTAFVNRPEIREEILNKSGSLRDIKMSIIETFPGADLLFNYNYDSNSFLVYPKWTDGIIGLTQSINKILTAPVRYMRAKNMDSLADKRRQALVAAVITQVHVARSRYDFLSQAYLESKQADSNANDILKRARSFKDSGLMSGAELLNVEVDSNVARVNRAFAYADAQSAYGHFITTLGVDLWDADDAGLSVPEYAQQISKNLADKNLFLLEPAAGGDTP